MRLHRLLFVPVFIAVALAGTMLRAARADASPPLQQSLAALCSLGPSSFSNLLRWAQNGAPQVNNPVLDYEKAEVLILNLDYYDRIAELAWLQGNGRTALYQQGATDAQIGPPRPGVDASVPTPSPWRELRLASATLDQSAQGNVQVLSGFGAVRRDGLGANVCVSFQNIARRVATRVIFQFTLFDRFGNSVGGLNLDRKGTFSPNVGIMTYQNYSTWSTGNIGPRGYADNCAAIALAVTALPLLQARYVGYRVARVEYADGSVWVPATTMPR